MVFLTIFTAPKPFTNPHIATIQRNAIHSWLQLGDEVEVFLVGTEVGMAEVSAELGVRHLPDVRRNEWGTPMVSSIFEVARAASEAPILAYLNADIVVLPDFVDTARQVAAQAERFLVVGRRWNLDIRQDLDFSPGWDARLRTEVQARGLLYSPAGIDYFLFPRSLYTRVPDFAIGRAGWDNWMIYHALRSGWAVINATSSLMVVHQDHDYSHLPGGKPHYTLEESRQNVHLAGGYRHIYNILDANCDLVGGRICRPRLTPARLLRWAERVLMPENQMGWRWWLVRKLRQAQRSLVVSRS